MLKYYYFKLIFYNSWKLHFLFYLLVWVLLQVIYLNNNTVYCISQVEDFDFNKYNEIPKLNRPFRHTYNLNQFKELIDLVDEGKFEDNTVNYTRYLEFNKEFYLSPNKLTYGNYNSLYDYLYNSQVNYTFPQHEDLIIIKRYDGVDFESCVKNYILNLTEWVNNIFLPDLKSISKLLNSNDIYLPCSPTAYIKDKLYFNKNYTLYGYYRNFAISNNYIIPRVSPDYFIDHLDYLFKISNNLFNEKLEFNLYKFKFQHNITLGSYDKEVLNIKLL